MSFQALPRGQQPSWQWPTAPPSYHDSLLAMQAMGSGIHATTPNVNQQITPFQENTFPGARPYQPPPYTCAKPHPSAPPADDVSFGSANSRPVTDLVWQPSVSHGPSAPPMQMNSDMPSSRAIRSLSQQELFEFDPLLQHEPDQLPQYPVAANDDEQSLVYFGPELPPDMESTDPNAAETEESENMNTSSHLEKDMNSRSPGVDSENETLVFDNESGNLREGAKDSKMQYERDEDGNILHKVVKADTLQGIALRYQVKTGDICAANNVSTWTFQQRSVLVIPVATAFSKAIRPRPMARNMKESKVRQDAVSSGKIPTTMASVRRFTAEVDCNDLEGEAYLKMNENNFRKAVENYLGDERWEKATSRSMKDVVHHTGPKRRWWKSIFVRST